MQVDPIKPTLIAPGTKRLKLSNDKLLSSFGFNFNLRRYTKAEVATSTPTRARGGGGGGGGGSGGEELAISINPPSSSYTNKKDDDLSDDMDIEGAILSGGGADGAFRRGRVSTLVLTSRHSPRLTPSLLESNWASYDAAINLNPES